MAFLIEHRNLNPINASALDDEVRAIFEYHVNIYGNTGYRDEFSEAEWRIPADARDVPVVALSLALECGILTNDRDFFGCGVAVWSADVRRSYLESRGRGETE